MEIKQYNTEFYLTDEESKKFSQWCREHNKTCRYYNNSGAIEGRLTYKFTPTGLGCITVIECACGKKIDLTDYESW